MTIHSKTNAGINSINIIHGKGTPMKENMTSFLTHVCTCFSFIFCSSDKTCRWKQSKGKGVSWLIIPSPWGSQHGRNLEQLITLHPRGEKGWEQWVNARLLVLTFSMFIHSWTQSGNGTSKSGWVLSPHYSVKITAHWRAQGPVSHVVLDFFLSWLSTVSITL